MLDTDIGGIDVVTFSGDKLLGAPQAGLIVGEQSAITAMRKNPIYRALRLDKVTLAGLEATLELVLAGRGDEIPARAMMHRGISELTPLAHDLARSLTALAGVQASVEPSRAQPGSGSAPTAFLESVAVRVEHERYSAEALGLALRAVDPPVFGRIQDDAVWLDVRTVSNSDAAGIAEAFAALG